MKIPINWLKDFTDIDCDVQTFADRMTMSGSKVEAIEHLDDKLEKIVVGKVTDIYKHPDADKLYVTKVDVGTNTDEQIITGADNVYAGAFVPVVLDGGAVVVNGERRRITKGKMRGLESSGMLCSIQELGYGKQEYPEADEDGIYIFPSHEGLVPGDDACPALGLVEDVVEFELTSNRPDCFSVAGIAREAAATFDKPFRLPVPVVKEEADAAAADFISVEILNPINCPRYAARVVTDVTIGPSPQWMRRRLIAAGMRPVNNIVDITNYVMLEFGQPMHAFDIDHIGGRKIIVRNAYENESIVTLDGAERTLDAAMTVIADENKAVAIGGVMGGENSMVTGRASAILFESANFNGVNIRKTSKKLGLRTDASSKYEKGLDPNLCGFVLDRAAEIVELLGCGKAAKGTVDCYPLKRAPGAVKYKPERINKLLGTDIPAVKMEQYLNKLGIETKDDTAYVPTYRADIKIEADVAEEVARLYGYEKIRPTLAAGTPTVGKKNRRQILEDAVKRCMASQGFYEALHYTFESPKVFDKLNFPADSPLRNAIPIVNPQGEDFSVMRTTTLNGMLTSLSLNWNKRNENASLFEFAKIYLPKSLPLTELPEEREVLTAGAYGETDFYKFKGVVEELFDRLGMNGMAVYAPEKKLAHMHPGRTASVTVSGAPAGYIGEVHPDVTANYGIDARVYLAAIELTPVYEYGMQRMSYEPLPKFPSIKRDLAFVVNENALNADVERIILKNGGAFLESVALFDVYSGGQVPPGYKSTAYSLVFRAAERTLTEDEAGVSVKKILAALREQLDAELR